MKTGHLNRRSMVVCFWLIVLFPFFSRSDASTTKQVLGPIIGNPINIIQSKSADMCRIAFVSEIFKKQIVVVDGKPGREYDKILGKSLVFSSNGKRVAYVARKADDWFAVVDGEVSERYDKIWSESFIFSPDGNRFAYVAKNGTRYFVVENGKIGPEFDGLQTGGSLVSCHTSNVG